MASVTVPVEAVPPVTPGGFIVNDVSSGGVRVKVAVCVRTSFPEMVTEVELLTGWVVTRKVAVVAPAGTVTVAGTVASCFPELTTNISAMPKS